MTKTTKLGELPMELLAFVILKIWVMAMSVNGTYVKHYIFFIH